MYCVVSYAHFMVCQESEMPEDKEGTVCSGIDG